MVRRYKEQVRLTNGHTKGITAVSFSPEGTYITTAGLDGHVCLWDVDVGKLLHRYEGGSPVLSLAWVPSGEETLLFGTQDGNIGMLTVSIALNTFSMSGFWAHNYPVERLVITGDRVASGALREVKVWRWHALGDVFVCEAELPEPPKTSHNENLEILVTSLHWTGTDQDPILMAMYMYHGVQMFKFDATMWRSVRTISLQGKIASASLSADGSRLAVSNLVKGFDVYRTDTEKPIGVFSHTVGEPYPTPVLSIHGGSGIVGGTTTGIVTVWDLMMGKLHTLIIPEKGKVFALSAFCHVAPIATDFRFQIATGIFNGDAASDCIIWEAEELDCTMAELHEDPTSLSPDTDGVDVPTTVPPPTTHFMRSSMVVMVLSFVVVLFGLLLVPVDDR